MTEVKKTTIRPNTANMVKSGGSYHKPDFIGLALAGLTVAQVSLVAVAAGLDTAKYAHLNPGQQRMTLGNQMRKLTAIADVPEVDGKPDQKIVDKNEAAYAVQTKIEDLANQYRDENAAAKKAKDDEKAAVKEAKAAAKAAAKKSEKAAPVESEGGEV